VSAEGGAATRSSSVRRNAATNTKNESNSAAAKTFTSMDEKMSQYESMIPEPSSGVNSKTGRAVFSYHELVRRNYVRELDGIIQKEIEEHLSDGEFMVRFNVSKVSE
jgi:hypothetical protein